jgi:hypothetical protein
MKVEREQCVNVTIRLPAHLTESLDDVVALMNTTRSKLGAKMIEEALNREYLRVCIEAKSHRKAMEDLKKQNPDIDFDALKRN